MRFLLSALLLLTGCADQTASAEYVLNRYAKVATDRDELPRYLTGNALESANQTISLISELGLIASGSSTFSETKQLSENSFESCLDVSQTAFTDFTGLELELDRQKRQLVEVKFDGLFISDLELTGRPC